MSDLPEIQEDALDAGHWCMSPPPIQLFEISENASSEIQAVSDAFRDHCNAIHQSATAPAVRVTGEGSEPPSALADQVDEAASISASESALSPFSSPRPRDQESPASSIMSDTVDTSPFKGKQALRPHQAMEDVSRTMKRLFRSETVSRALKKGNMFANGQKLLSSEGDWEDNTNVECASCFEDTPSRAAAHLACKHRYCSECLVHLVETAMANESAWPPRCCLQEIPRKTILRRLPEKQLQTFGVKEQEYGTPAAKRWYCTHAGCGRWFKPHSMGSHVQCPHCQHEMCPHCRGARHTGKERCMQDAALAALEKEAHFEGWVHCPKCAVLVELTAGCRHITCLCSHQFCYVCSARWHTCSCTEADKDAVQRAAHRRRQARDLDAAEQRQAVEEAAAMERSVHEARMLNEKRFAEALERARTDAITKHFRGLRAELSAVQEAQSKTILHGLKADMISSQHLSKDLETEEAAARSDTAAIKREIEKQLQEAAVAATGAEKEMVQRQAVDRMKLYEVFAPLVNQGYCSQSDMHQRTDSLVIEQVREQKMRRQMQDHQLAKLKWRVVHFEELPEYAERKHSLRRRRQDTDNKLNALCERAIACEGWIKLAAAERPALLQGGETYLLASGGEVPGTEYPTEDDSTGNPTAGTSRDSEMSTWLKYQRALPELREEDPATSSLAIPGEWPLKSPRTTVVISPASSSGFEAAY